MILRELLPVIQSGITLKTADVRKSFGATSDIPEEWKRYIVTSVTSDENGIIVNLSEPQKVKSLEELGYSFEVGV